MRPVRLSDALAALAAGPRVLLAGGTDHYPARATFEPEEDIVDLSALPDLRRIERTGGVWRIPALATWTDLVEAELPAQFAGLRHAARQVGGWQIQNQGTIIGNVCNASPAADGIPPLLALDASIELTSQRGVRTLTLQDFLLGPRWTARRPDEVATALLVPDRDARSVFLKLGARRYLVISISAVAVTLAFERDRIALARVAVGACGPVPVRLPALEAALIGHAPSGDLVRTEHLAALAPIDDVRASAAYRREATAELIRRALDGMA